MAALCCLLLVIDLGVSSMQETLQDWRNRVGEMSGELILREPLQTYQQWLSDYPQGLQIE